jgi:hypothetical protein
MISASATSFKGTGLAFIDDELAAIVAAFCRCLSIMPCASRPGNPAFRDHSSKAVNALSGFVDKAFAKHSQTCSELCPKVGDGLK